ncbi:hypothetical protein C8R44DRAFT_881608 [Mycena epipterygia]|nr:hypothetical protein C8R44DRAFT_881608 [Mycena epipterygia]
MNALDFFTSPALSDISFHSNRDVGPDCLVSIQSLVLRSCTIRRLCVKGYPDDYMMNKDLRQHLSIVDLVIITFDYVGAALADTLSSQLTNQTATGEPVMAPQLRGVFFGCEDDCGIHYALYVDMLRSRWKEGRSALKSAGLVIDCRSRPSSEVLDRLDSLRSDDLDFMYLTEAFAFFEIR